MSVATREAQGRRLILRLRAQLKLLSAEFLQCQCLLQIVSPIGTWIHFSRLHLEEKPISTRGNKVFEWTGGRWHLVRGYYLQIGWRKLWLVVASSMVTSAIWSQRFSSTEYCRQLSCYCQRRCYVFLKLRSASYSSFFSNQNTRSTVTWHQPFSFNMQFLFVVRWVHFIHKHSLYTSILSSFIMVVNNLISNAVLGSHKSCPL